MTRLANFQLHRSRLPARKSELPVRNGTIGPAVVDIAPLYKDLGVFTYDPGFGSPPPPRAASPTSTAMRACCCIAAIPSSSSPRRARSWRWPTCCCTASCRTEAARGVHRQHPLSHDDQRVVAALLQRLPPQRPSDGDGVGGGRPRCRRSITTRWTSITRGTARSSRIASSRRSRRSPPPRTSIRSASRSSIRATISTTAATCCTCSSRCPASPTSSIPCVAKALDLLFVLHADHEQNASTSTVRLAGSTGANPYAAISAGVSALWGPAHGGANEAVLAMLEQIGTVENIPKYLAMAKDKSSHFRLMGFGHRVYKNFDPRAKIIRAMCHQVLEKLGQLEQSAVRARAAARGDRAQGRVLRRAQALSERGFLLGHHLQRASAFRARCSR